MKTIGDRVMDTIANVLDIHPTVRGFQVLNDNGVHLIDAYRKKWIPDTPGRRRRVLTVLRNWNTFSNSSPVEGLERAGSASTPSGSCRRPAPRATRL